jgi:hypothetical protein
MLLSSMGSRATPAGRKKICYGKLIPGGPNASHVQLRRYRLNSDLTHESILYSNLQEIQARWDHWM